MFSGVTTVLYPLSVIKTKQMTLPNISGGFKGVRQTCSTIMRTEGVPGFYRGFGTVICGTIPARAVYLTTLEWTKSEVGKAVSTVGLAGPAAAGVANFFGGALASLATQSVTVPIDVISQKQIVHGDETVVARHQQHSRSPALQRPGGPAAAAGSAAAAGPGPGQTAAAAAESAAAAAPSTSAGSAAPAAERSATGAGASTSGRAATTAAAAAERSAAETAVRRIGSLQMVRLIIKEEGLTGLYRGFGASVATFVPSSAVWWGAYGTYQKLFWSLAYGSEGGTGGGGSGSGGGAQPAHSTGEVVGVQVLSSVLAGCTSSLFTTPLDLIKTRIQVSYKHDGATPSFLEVAKQIAREDGPAGFLRGAVPRMLNASLWGTCMVSVYEYLKRICAKDEEAAATVEAAAGAGSGVVALLEATGGGGGGGRK
ncbi:hypothetical protein HYH03_000834 [Edaphochlamys debaryana]|uniref:Mitochondrial carrier protein n=1 Tax=Edaphochlamys debaryana TaxID=47281 RepID=A0A835YFX2_9CHLO|nr:hypothetical protein HYH03_000834 [Edaphochlamys debaryana]|eukprot:KAG2501014.1 hypothetical protein HYH03_000834 [Edaphochlamys debaryana]